MQQANSHNASSDPSVATSQARENEITKTNDAMVFSLSSDLHTSNHELQDLKNQLADVVIDNGNYIHRISVLERELTALKLANHTSTTTEVLTKMTELSTSSTSPGREQEESSIALELERLQRDLLLSSRMARNGFYQVTFYTFFRFLSCFIYLFLKALIYLF